MPCLLPGAQPCAVCTALNVACFLNLRSRVALGLLSHHVDLRRAHQRPSHRAAEADQAREAARSAAQSSTAPERAYKNG